MKESNLEESFKGNLKKGDTVKVEGEYGRIISFKPNLAKVKLLDGVELELSPLESTLKKSSDSKSDYEFVIESEGGLIEKIEESLNSIMDPKKKLEIFDKLKKGDEVHIKYIPGGVNEKGSTFTVKNKKNFAKGEQILLSKNDGNAAAKYYLYKRGGAGIVSFSLGDLGSPILDMSIKETVELEEAYKKGEKVKILLNPKDEHDTGKGNPKSKWGVGKIVQSSGNDEYEVKLISGDSSHYKKGETDPQVYGAQLRPLDENEELTEATKKPDWSDSMLDLYIRKDRNGNKVLKVVLPDLRFNIQTNGNLPKTHSRGAGDHTIGELVKYVKSYGSTMQKNAISIYARRTKIDEGVEYFKNASEIASQYPKKQRENLEFVKSKKGSKEFIKVVAPSGQELERYQLVPNTGWTKLGESIELEETVELSEVSKGVIAKALGGPAFANDTLYMQVFKDAGDSKKREESLGRLKKARGAEAYERTKKALKRLEDHGFKFEEVESAELQEGVGKFEVKLVKTKKIDDPDAPDIQIIKNYKIRVAGKDVGELETESIFGSVEGKLYGKNLPELSGYGQASDSGPQSNLHKFLKSKTGQRWAKNVPELKESTELEEVESAELQEGSDVTLESYIQTENSSWARQIKHLPGQPYIAVVKNKDGQEKYIGKTSYSDHTTALEEGSLWLKTVKNGVPQMVVERTISGFINSAVQEGKVTFK